VANVDAALIEQILDLPQRQRETDLHHHRKANDLGRRLEVAERIFHSLTLPGAHLQLKPVPLTMPLIDPTKQCRLSSVNAEFASLRAPTTPALISHSSAGVTASPDRHSIDLRR